MPEKNKPRFHLFIGWWTVLFIGIVSGLGHGFNTYGISVFFKDIAAELGLNRALTSLGAGFGKLESGFTSPIAGWLSDKYGPRGIVVIGVFAAAVGMVLMNFITEVWHYYVAWGVMIGLGLNFGLTLAVDKTITDWFIRRRGLAQGIKFGLIGVFGVVVLQIITPLMVAQGWRFTCLIWGIIMFASIPLCFVLVKPKRPEYYGLLPDGAETGLDADSDRRELLERSIGYASSLHEVEFTRKQATTTAAFWLLLIGSMVHNFVSAGFNAHAFPFLTDIGIEWTVAGGMMSMMVFCTIPARLFGGIIADRVPKNRLQILMAGALFLQVIGIGSYLLYPNVITVYILLVCHGLSSGGLTPIVLLILGRYFGRRAFGSILGTMAIFFAPLGFLGPIYYGWIFDATGNYNIAFITVLALALIAALVTVFVRPPDAPLRDDSQPVWSAG